MTLYDLEKCFDSLDLVECCNDMFETGIQNDKINVIYEGNRENQVAINTPSGKTERTSLPDILCQGASLPPLICGVSVDRLGKEANERKSENLPKYKGSVPITMLSMIDDLLSISECGIKSIENNAYINAMFEMKNLKLNESKCHNIHVGKNQDNCVKLKAHEDILLNVDSDKYVGDIVSKDGKNTKNIKSRIGKGIGQISNIMNILKQVSLGQYYFEMSLLLRESFFLSSVLLNAETWVNLSKTDIEDLEKLDETLLRRLLNAPAKTPISALYLELGIVPIRYHITIKRLMFLHHILQCDESRLVSQVFWAQEKSPAKNDWVLQVKDDLQTLGLDYLTFHNIKAMKKKYFQSLIKTKTKSTAFKYLIEEKESKAKSKMSRLEYKTLNIQPYLLSNKMNLRRKGIMFKLRTRMISTPENFGRRVQCKICDLEDDTTSHIFSCLFLKLEVPDVMSYSQITVDDAYKEDVEKMGLLAQIFAKLWRKREEILYEMTRNT